MSKKAVEEVSVGEKTGSSSEFVDVFDVDISASSPKEVKRRSLN